MSLFKAFKQAYKEPPKADPQPAPDQSALSIEVPNSNKEKLLNPTTKLFSALQIETSKKYEYDPDKYPPDIKMAKDHALARRVSIPSYLYEKLDPAKSKEVKSEPVDLCDCCACPLKNEPLPLCTDRMNLFFLGAGFPLFFDFIVWGLFMLLIIFLVSSIFGLASNSKVLQLGPNYSWFVELSLANNEDPDISNWKAAQMIVNFFTILILLIFLQFFRRRQRKIAFECDFRNLSPADFTLKVSGLPLNFLDYELEEHFQKIGGDQLSIKVIKINKTYSIFKYVELKTKREQLFSERREAEEKIIENNEKLKDEKIPQGEKAKIKAEIPKLEAIIKDRESQFEKLDVQIKEESDYLMKSYVKFTGTAYVTFETPQQAAFIKKKLKIPFEEKIKAFFLRRGVKFDQNHFYLGKTLIEVERAPEPNDIVWENLGTSWVEKFRLQWRTAFYTFLVLVVCFAAIFGLTFLQKYLTVTNENDPPPPITNSDLSGFVNALGAICISIINYLLNFVIKRFASIEKHLTVTGLNSSIASKKIIAQFLNTAVIYIIISWIKDDWRESTGLIKQLLNICISTICINSALFAFDPMYILLLWKRRQVIKNTSKSTMTQSEAHKLFEDPSLDIPNLYSGVVNVMLFSAFYATLEPLVVLFGLVTLAVYYWIFKFLLLRRSSIPTELGKKIAYDMIEYMEYVPLTMALGDVLFNVIFYNLANPWSITACCLCFVNFLVPMAWVNKKIFTLDEKHIMITSSVDYTKKFNDSRANFTFEYDRLNPVTMKKAVEEWVTFVEKKDNPTLSDDKKKEFAQNLFTTLQRTETENIKEEQKENGESQLVERKPTEGDGLDFWNTAKTNKGKKVDPSDKRSSAVAAMFGQQTKPKGLFLGLGPKK